MYDLVTLGKNARIASRKLRVLKTSQRNDALLAVAKALRSNIPAILEANRLDVANAKSNGIKTAMLDRLTLSESRIEAIALAVEEVVSLPDPIGIVESGGERPNGLLILKTKVPIGVIAMIYEARPNVTVDAASLCLKSGNACILRGGKEAYASNRTLINIMRDAIEQAGVPKDAIAMVEDTSRETASRLMKLEGYIDLLIPRGGAGLIQHVVKEATVPTIETGAGNCHMYIDSMADLDMAVRVVNNGKTSRPSVCNALETVLVHRDVAVEFLPMMKKALDEHEVEIRGCEKTREILKSATAATEEDWATEYDDYILAVKVVADIDEAISHIERYSTAHSDGIITDSESNSRKFVSQVDSAAVYVNASTRFTDGGEFGLGSEIGISTQKLHTRGPMGLNDLTTIKYVITGEGQIRV